MGSIVLRASIPPLEATVGRLPTNPFVLNCHPLTVDSLYLLEFGSTHALEMLPRTPTRFLCQYERC